MKNKAFITSLIFILVAILFAIINPTWQSPVKINNHEPEVSKKDSLWQEYCKNGDTASAKPNVNSWVVIENSKDMLNPFTDTVFATYWQQVANNQYVVKCKKYGSITVEFCRLLPDSIKSK